MKARVIKLIRTKKMGEDSRPNIERILQYEKINLANLRRLKPNCDGRRRVEVSSGV